MTDEFSRLNNEARKTEGYNIESLGLILLKLYGFPLSILENSRIKRFANIHVIKSYHDHVRLSAYIGYLKKNVHYTVKTSTLTCR